MTSPDNQNYTPGEIDVEIANLEARILSLKSIRNTLAHISRLHPEILQEIFNISQVSSRHKGRAALLLTWISRYWRELAHETSDLWTYIDFGRPEWISTALSRARDRTLDIELSLTRPAPSTIQLCLGNMSRIRRLNIRHQYNTTYPGWSNPAPHLVALDLWGVSLPANIFSRACPSLRSLALLSCKFDWETFPHGLNLTELSISSPGTKTTIDKMLEVLKVNARDVKVLEIEYALESSPNPTGSLLSHPNRVQFDHIHTLRINEYQSATIKQLLDRIYFPHLPDTAMVVLSTEGEELDTRVIAQALASARGLSVWDIDHLNISMAEGAWTTLGVSRKAGEGSEEFVLPTASIQSIESVYLTVGDANLASFDYFGTKTAVRKLVCESDFVSQLIRLIDIQLHQLATIIPVERGVTSPTWYLDEKARARARNILTFHDLRFLELQEKLSGLDLVSVRSWLAWRQRAGLPRFEKLVVSTVLDESSERIVEEIEVTEFVGS